MHNQCFVHAATPPWKAHHQGVNARSGCSAIAILLAVNAGVLTGCSTGHYLSTFTSRLRGTSSQAHTDATGTPSAAPTTERAATPTSATVPVLRPGPHSLIGDVDLPEGTVPCTGGNCPAAPLPTYETWYYKATYEDILAFLRARFATGRRYDGYGATWWNGLPPCYGTTHRSPPWGTTVDEFSTEWIWSDGAVSLIVQVIKPTSVGNVVHPSWILITRGDASEGLTCYRA
jgi:hypothetical protein